MSAIFPVRVRDIDYEILSFIPARDLYLVRRVNHIAYKTISNDYYHLRFKKDHPLLAFPSPVFVKLSTYHPNNCWQVMCHILPPASPKISHRSDPFRKPAFQVFFSEAIPVMLIKGEAQKKALDTHYRNICGDRYGDPSSPIHQAHVNSKKAAKAFTCRELDFHARGRDMYAKIDRMSKDERQDFDECTKKLEAAFNNYRNTFDNPGDLDVFILSITEKQFKKLLEETVLDHPTPKMLKTIRIKNPHIYASISYFDSFNKKYAAKARYDTLEGKRVECVQCQTRNKWNLRAIKSGNTVQVIENHGKDLSEECKNVRLLESYLMKVSIEYKCLFMIKEVQNASDQDSKKEGIDQIRVLINSLPYGERAHIWKTLYRQCANGMREHKWAEHHFHECFPSLEKLIAGLIINQSDWIKQLQEALSAPNKWEVLPNFNLN